MAKQSSPGSQASRIDRAERAIDSPAASQPKPDMIDRLGDWIEKNHANPGEKWGAGHAAAMFRAGLKELTQILPAFNNGIQPVEEPGLAGVPTNIEVVDAKEGATESRGQPQVKGAVVESPLESQVRGVAVDPAEPVRPMDTPGMNPLEQFRSREVQPSREREITR